MLTAKEGPVFGLPAELDIEFQPESAPEKPITIEQLPDSMRSVPNSLQTVFEKLQPIREFLTPSIISQPSPPAALKDIAVEVSGIGKLTYQWIGNGCFAPDGNGKVAEMS
jgi:hypothetical protein